MGGADLFYQDNDADIMHNSSLISLNLLRSLIVIQKTSKSFTQVQLVYIEEIQESPDNPGLKESDAYPANPDLNMVGKASERLYLSYMKNYKMDIKIARFIIYTDQTELGTEEGKNPAAMCRKVAETKDGNIEVWGDGKQTRSFLFINDCIEATRRLMNSQVFEPINIGSEEMVSINQLVEIVSKIANKKIKINHIDGPLGVRGRNSENSLVREVLNWDYEYSLEDGIKITYEWISKQIIKS